ncbi:MAG: LPS-assembly protein LptD [Candidatus Latescibacteria bacterium]|nr:LPS-assembly protein LptD [Candidatus Latescibacterota bacterium]
MLSDSLEYSAESIDYFFNDRKVVMDKNATILYLGRTLKSPIITFYQDYDYMEATGTIDSTGAYIELPTFRDKTGEELRGTEIKYNLKTEEGVVRHGKTKYDEGFYNSDTIKRVSDDTLYVANGTFTTCDKEDHPHFYFAGQQMKFIVNDKIIIRPITAYVNDIPVFWFPFYVYPIARGRQSGFLTPRYGSSRRDGRYISNMGYYFAPSDYWDYRVSGVLREKNGWLTKNWINYNKRYSMSGSIFGSYEDRSESGTKEWELQFNHRHTVSPTLSITGSGNFQSSEYSQYNSYNLYERMNRDMRSSLSIQKKWADSGNSLTTTFNHQKNLDTKNTTVTIPNMRFRKPRKQIFGSKENKNKRRKYTKQDMSDDVESAWYEDIYYSFDSGFTNTEQNQGNTGSAGSDNEEFSRELSMNTGLSSSYKLMGWLVSEPSMTLSEKFLASNKYDQEERYRRNDNISMQLGLSTTVYGMFAPNIGNVKGIRHVVKPSVSYSYGKRRHFYSNEADAFFQLDENDEEKGKVQSMNLNLRNLIQVKTVNGEKENKFDLFTLNFSSSVDFEEDKRKIGPLSTTLDFTPLKQYMSTRLTASHDFYHDDDTFQLFSPYLTNISITTSLKHSGSGAGFMGRSSRDDANSDLGRDDFTLNDFSEPAETEGTTGGGGGFPINMQFSHSYQIRRSTQTAPGKYKYKTTHTIKPTISFSPTQNISLNYYLYYDIKEKDVNFHRIVLNRDLHCWEANISWVPSGASEGYYFKVNIKDLPDIKIEKRRGTSQTSY